MSVANLSAHERFIHLEDALEEIDRLKEALGFYARRIAYQGDNQRNDGFDRYTPKDDPYIKSVGRDGGSVARKALDQL